MRREENRNDLKKEERKKKKNIIKIGTWNVRSLNMVGKLENLKREMSRTNINLMGISEVKAKNEQDFWSEDFRVITTNSVNGITGVGFVMDKSLGNRVDYYEQLNDRVILIKIDTKPVKTTVVQVYMPTSQADDEVIELLYEEIENLVEHIKGDENLIIMGDWNAIVGQKSEEGITGEYGLGERNVRGNRLIDFCNKQNLVITNTLFKNPKRRIYTWKRPGDLSRHQLDYIMVRKRFRNQIMDCKSFPGADINSDHNPVIMKCRLKLKKLKKRKLTKRWNLQKLKENEGKEDFEKRLDERLKNIPEGINVEEEWEFMKSEIVQTGDEILGFKKGEGKQPWITEDILLLMDERRQFKNAKDEEGKKRYKVLKNEINRKCKKAKEFWLKERCDDIENCLIAGRIDAGYRKIKEHFGERKIKSGNLKDANGKPLLEKCERADRWKEYIEELYKGEELNNFENEEEVKEDEKGDLILRDEFDRALNDLKNGKAVGVDEIPAEMLKSMGKEGLDRLYKLVSNIYETSELPNDFLKSVIFTLPKKAKADKCELFRTISITSHAMKILTRIVYRRIEQRVDNNLNEDQFGFRKSRGTREAILTLRLIMEGRLKKNKITCMAFVDMEKAFDKVKWNLMFEILKKAGLKYRDRKLIYNLYKNQAAVVKIENEERVANIGKGVRQGCSLSSLLFNLYMEEAMNILKEMDTSGVIVQGEKIKMLRFADDLILLTETGQDLEILLNRLNVLLKEKYGMSINKNKTKVMTCSRDEDGIELGIQIEGAPVEQVKEFTYLGSKITRDGRSRMDIKSRIGQGKKAFYLKKFLLRSNISLQMRKIFIKSYVWSTVLYGSETWTVGLPEKRAIEAFEMWCYRRMLKIKWIDRVTNEEVLRRVGEERNLWKMLTKRRDQLIGHNLRHTSLTLTVLEGMVEGRNCRGRQRMEYVKQIVEDLGCRSYVELKRLAQDRDSWRDASNQSHD